MSRLNISTYKYPQLLDDFAAEAEKNGWLAIRHTGREAGRFYINCSYDRGQPVLANGLMALLTQVAIEENPVYQHSSKLRDMARDLPSPYEPGLVNLRVYLQHSDKLHLEGYVAFRMGEYREKLDMMSYSLIKKLKLIRHD